MAPRVKPSQFQLLMVSTLLESVADRPSVFRRDMMFNYCSPFTNNVERITQAVTEEFLRTRIQLAASAIAVIGVVVYGIGFLVLTIHHESFGIPLSGFLRPRIISAGILFCALVAIPIAELLFIMKRTKWPETKKDVRDFLSLCVGFLLEALAISLITLRFAFVGFPEQSLSHYYGWAGAALIVPSAVWALPWWNQWGKIPHLVGFFGIYTWVAFCLYKASDRTLALLVVWFLICGYLTNAVQNALRNPSDISVLGWIQGVIGGLGIVGFFALLLYPALPSAYFGGVPVPITFQFSEKSVPILNSTQLKGWLLDETDDGFYFIQDTNAKKAVFIPRSNVIAVYYGEQK